MSLLLRFAHHSRDVGGGHVVDLVILEGSAFMDPLTVGVQHRRFMTVSIRLRLPLHVGTLRRAA
ncbi:MAG TPA: hypothetical protein QGF35_01170 [Dehalococcoidia bacterium]|nr:hypothetical protein [Dehalococcoidia bacterium]